MTNDNQIKYKKILTGLFSILAFVMLVEIAEAQDANSPPPPTIKTEEPVVPVEDPNKNNMSVLSVGKLKITRISRRRSPARAILLSLWPGAGQRYNGQKQKGNYFIALESFGIAAILISGHSALRDRKDYRNGAEYTDFDEIVKKYNISRRANNIAVYVTSGIFFLSAIDAWLSAKAINRRLSINVSISDRIIGLSYAF